MSILTPEELDGIEARHRSSDWTDDQTDELAARNWCPGSEDVQRLIGALREAWQERDRVRAVLAEVAEQDDIEKLQARMDVDGMLADATAAGQAKEREELASMIHGFGAMENCPCYSICEEAIRARGKPEP